MSKFFSHFTSSALFMVLVSFSACSSSGGDSGGDSYHKDVAFETSCGSVQNGSVKNPVTKVSSVTVEPLSGDTVIVTNSEGESVGQKLLVKLQSISSDSVSPSQNHAAVQLIKNLTSSGANIVYAGGDSCNVTTDGGGTARLGTLYTNDGKNVSEVLVERALVNTVGDNCKGEELASCLSSIKPKRSDIVIRDFLWKPVSERNRALAILVDPVAIKVVVRGSITEELVDFGPGNGRGTTARAVNSGCKFGRNVRVEFYDQQNLRVYTASGLDAITVENGCSRIRSFY